MNGKANLQALRCSPRLMGFRNRLPTNESFGTNRLGRMYIFVIRLRLKFRFRWQSLVTLFSNSLVICIDCEPRTLVGQGWPPGNGALSSYPSILILY